MSFISDDFLLSTASARHLYHSFAEGLPLVDYHCHLSPQDIAQDRRFENLTQLWLEGDHYKWRAMRADGVPERLITGDAPPREKFLAYARTVPQTLRNPLYHWTHLELLRAFGIRELLNEASGPRIWDQTRERLQEPAFSAQGLLRHFQVELVGTTDDPTDSLEWHRALAQQEVPFRMVPTFRPDRALQTADVARWNAWVDKLAAVTGSSCADLSRFLSALEQRHQFFHDHGGRLSDHGLARCPWGPCSETEARQIYSRLRGGQAVEPLAQEHFAFFVLSFVGRLNARRGWAMQLHLGAQRNNSTRLFRQLGPDIGCDSISDEPQAAALAAFLDALDASDELPKTVVYNLNPAANYAVATALGNFGDGRIPGKMQYGSGWWFLDQLEGMRWQMDALSNLGLLSRFVGMLTDSRSLLSFPRHEYFRRLLCRMLGEEVERGELPNDDEMLGRLIRGVCYRNAREFFGFTE